MIFLFVFLGRSMVFLRSFSGRDPVMLPLVTREWTVNGPLLDQG